MTKTDIRLDIRPYNWTKYGRVVTKLKFHFNDDILTTHSEFHTIVYSVDKPNMQPNIRVFIRIKFLLSKVLYNDFIHARIKFYVNLLNIKEVKKSEIGSEIWILTKI